MQIIHPEGWKPPSGYSNGILAPAGSRILFVAGQVAWDADQRLVGPGDFPTQFAQALKNVAAVVQAAGGTPEHVTRLTIFVTDKHLYMQSVRAIGQHYRATFGPHYPAMSLVQVAALLEEGALVEIEATAALPGQ